MSIEQTDSYPFPFKYRVCAINLGTRPRARVREVIEAVQRVPSNSFTVEQGPLRIGDPAVLVADATRARDILNWTARHSDLDTIIRDAWAYAEAHL